MDNLTKIKLIVLDVDGVLTDGKLFIGSDGEEYKGFNTQDGMGISFARYTGIKTAIITGRKSEAVAKRAKELKIDYLFQGIHEKLDVLEEIKKELGLKYEEICYIGDDINDLPILQVVGYPCAPNNAVEIVKKACKKVAKKNGGAGAVRELIDEILTNQENYDEILIDFLSGNVKVVQ
ncbi:KdsC family phosphatase [Sutcliffiella horikoshii]|uniref:KdsC family phosphatase n=1 Tax=Sutcliffiella horikoshii TaxID=79883 RepID=UPI003CF2B932